MVQHKYRRPLARRDPTTPHSDHSVPYAETLAALYLVLPLLIFFASFVRLEIGVPGCVLIIYQTYDIIRSTSLCEPAQFNFQSMYFTAMTALWAWSSAVVGRELVLHNFDCSKHCSPIDLRESSAVRRLRSFTFPWSYRVETA